MGEADEQAGQGVSIASGDAVLALFAFVSVTLFLLMGISLISI